MSNRILNAIAEEKINIFINSFSNTSKLIFYDEDKKKLIHPGEFGTYRENICRDFLKFFIPAKLKIDSGFVINANNGVSTQCDLIIFDSNATPLIETSERQRFFPVETVVSVIEVKSVLNLKDFKKAVNKLSQAKALKENVPSPSILWKYNNDSFDPTIHFHDQIFTAIICQRLDFNLNSVCEKINGFYNKDVHYRNRHNAILSVEDGVFLYSLSNIEGNAGTCHSPMVRDVEMKHRFIKYCDKQPDRHIKLFINFLFMFTSYATILYPEISDYLENTKQIEQYEYNDQK